MMVALIVEKSSGGKTRVCNSRCYDAKYPECICCCGGRNHGIGLNHAVNATRKAVEEILNKDDNTIVKLPFKEVQL